ncbi:TonB-dependent receptor plug domain-containing protein [Sphingomonas sp. ASV193]|uniref:TonB-dependent receptor plug domain-containing protein n=1 Tax=Sphingomonas sp. ASV193 TaxID=3144405 RepID=UPI0032E8B7B3
MTATSFRAIARSGLFAGASIGSMLLATPALAQDAQAPVATQESQPVDPAAPPPTKIVKAVPKVDPVDKDAIVVTGTRLRQPEFTSPDPVQRIDPALAEKSGKISLGDTLQSSPIAAGSTQITTALSSNLVTDGGPGSQTIDLRGLGPNRTLVLLNGRRAGPAGTRGGVSSFDLNVLPQSIVKNVDILKTGASSIYGSDAVAGVVNLVTKTDFNGLQSMPPATSPARRAASSSAAACCGARRTTAAT